MALRPVFGEAFGLPDHGRETLTKLGTEAAGIDVGAVDDIRRKRGIETENMKRLVDVHAVDQHHVVAGLAAANKKVSCFGSAIANWARPITIDPAVDQEDLQRAIPRMHALNTPFIRVMSYPNDPDKPIAEAEWRGESIQRMKTLAKMAEDGGVTLVHENCSGWGGLSAENSNILLGEINSPALKVVFDTGNPVTYGQDAWDYYKAVEADIAYVHNGRREIPTFVDGLNGKLFLKIYNLGNLLSDDWGKQYDAQFFTPVQVDMSVNDAGQYVFEDFNDRSVTDLLETASLWQARLGVEIRF